MLRIWNKQLLRLMLPILVAEVVDRAKEKASGLRAAGKVAVARLSIQTRVCAVGSLATAAMPARLSRRPARTAKVIMPPAYALRARVVLRVTRFHRVPELC